jgi:hypothetical protein
MYRSALNAGVMTLTTGAEGEELDTISNPRPYYETARASRSKS